MTKLVPIRVIRVIRGFWAAGFRLEGPVPRLFGDNPAAYLNNCGRKVVSNRKEARCSSTLPSRYVMVPIIMDYVTIEGLR
jgi:hypothetical protein